MEVGERGKKDGRRQVPTSLLDDLLSGLLGLGNLLRRVAELVRGLDLREGGREGVDE